MKTNELIDLTLNHAVHIALGLGYRRDEKYGSMYFRPSQTQGVIAWDSYPRPYSTDWSQGGPIIEQEKIATEYEDNDSEDENWLAYESGLVCFYGPTLLIAAMRCFVASKLGDVVDVPEELL